MSHTRYNLPPTPGFEHTHPDSDSVVEVKVMLDSDRAMSFATQILGGSVRTVKCLTVTVP